jgi:peptidylprolyl isomerase
MAIKNGDFVLVDYLLRIKDSNEVFDVTMEDQAKASNAYSPEEAYEPKLLVVGQGWMLKGIDEALLDASEGQEKDIEIPPSKGFGERDGSKVRIVPAKELTKQGVTPRPGQRVEVGGSLVTIRAVGSGRVTIDYNHPLAGKTIAGKVYVRKVISEAAERMRELIHRRIRNVNKDKFIISNLGKVVTIDMPEESFTVEDIQFAKKGLAKEISKYFPEVTTVQFTESHVVKVEPPKEEKAAKPSEAPKEAKAETPTAPAEVTTKEEKTSENAPKAKRKSQQPKQ